MASDSCGAESNEGICSASTQSLVINVFIGGLLAGFFCAVSALSGARRMRSGVWRTAFTFAVLLPLVCTTIAFEIASFR